MVALATLAAASPVCAQNASEPRSLRSALEELAANGLSVIFTEALVLEHMQVTEEPQTDDPVVVLQALLAPHGLVALERTEGLWVVARATGARLSQGIAGRVLARHSQEPVAGVSLSARNLSGNASHQTTSRGDGHFALPDLPAGSYSLVFERTGFLPETLARLDVREEGTPLVTAWMTAAPYLHEEIVVRSGNITLIGANPASPLSLSRDQIEALPHLGNDVFRTLELFPGVTSNDISARFNVHGGRPDEVKVLLDGQELYNAFHLEDWGGALSQVDAGELGNAALTTGGFAAEHGDRMGAVLDLRTRGASGPLRGRLNASLLSIALSGAGPIARERGGWLASARRGSLDLAGRLYGDERPEFWDGFAKLEWIPTSRERLRAHSLTARNQLRFTEQVLGDDFIEESNFATNYNNAVHWLSHQVAVGYHSLATTRVSWSEASRNRLGLENEEDQSFMVDDRRDSSVIDLSHGWIFQLSPRRSLEAGLQARRFDAEFDYFNRSDQELGVAAPGSAASTSDRVQTSHRSDHFGSYVTGRFAPDPLTIEVGLRYDRHTLTDDTLLSPRFNLAWRVAPRTVARLHWGLFHQSQRPYELQVEDGVSTFFPAERSEHRTLSFEQQVNRKASALLRTVRVELYRREVDNPRPEWRNIYEPFNTFPEVERDRTFLAPDYRLAEGVELSLRGGGHRNVGWWLNYTHGTSEDHRGSERLPRPQSEPDSAAFGLNLILPRHFQLNLAWRYHTGWPTTPASLAFRPDEDGEPTPILIAGSLYADRLPDYHRLDIRLSRRWQFSSSQLRIFLDLQNAYDRDNIAGFDFEVTDDGLLERHPEEWAGIFPSLGIDFRW